MGGQVGGDGREALHTLLLALQHRLALTTNTLHLANVTLLLLLLLVVCVCLFVTTAVWFAFIILTLKPRKKNLKFFYTIVCLSGV